MINQQRITFNRLFSDSAYQALVDELEKYNGKPVPFRIAETPVFIPEQFKLNLLDACDSIIRLLNDPEYLKIARKNIPDHLLVPGNDSRPLWLTFDFAVSRNANNEFVPRLIEMQGFPSLFGYQNILANSYRKYFNIENQFSHLEKLAEKDYIRHLKSLILNDYPPEQVILMDIEPEKQDTHIDFMAIKQMTGIRSICISKVIIQGKNLFYDDEGKLIEIKRIFNRVIFDELLDKKNFNFSFDFKMDYNVEWAGHPNWFFLASKFTLPYLESDFIPQSFHLNEIAKLPADLENYILKPLYSFSGKGVVFNVNTHDINTINDKHNWILQKKVEYTPLFFHDDEPVKAEIRLMYSWETGSNIPRLLTNMVRLSKGKMTGVKYNKNKKWVGSSVGFWKVKNPSIPK